MSQILSNENSFSIAGLLPISTSKLLEFIYAGKSNMLIHTESLKARSMRNNLSFEDLSKQPMLDTILVWMN
jgi:hypothetical protein